MTIVIGKMAMAVCLLTVQGCVHDDCDQQGSCSWMHDVRQSSTEMKWNVQMNVECLMYCGVDVTHTSLSSVWIHSSLQSFLLKEILKFLCVISINRHYIYLFAFCPHITSVHSDVLDGNKTEWLHCLPSCLTVNTVWICGCWHSLWCTWMLDSSLFSVLNSSVVVVCGASSSLTRRVCTSTNIQGVSRL